MYLVVSCSLNPSSRSRTLAKLAFQFLREAGHDARFVDLRDYALPSCDGDACYEDENVQRIGAMIHDASGVLLASPIYNFDVNAAAKNLALRLSRGELVLLLDPSVEVLGDLFDPTRQALADHQVGLVGPWGLTTTDLNGHQRSPTER